MESESLSTVAVMALELFIVESEKAGAASGFEWLRYDKCRLGSVFH